MNFQQADEQFRKLKARYAAGGITQAEFKAQLQDLMVQDAEGDWWMIGYETEKWYRYDGKDWVPADPPGFVPIAAGTGGREALRRSSENEPISQSAEIRESQSAEEAEQAANQNAEEARIARAAFQEKRMAAIKAQEEAERSAKPKANPPDESRPVPRPPAILVERPGSPSPKKGGVPLKILAGLNTLLGFSFLVLRDHPDPTWGYLLPVLASFLMAILAFVISNRAAPSIPAFPKKESRSNANQWADIFLKVMIGLQVVIALPNLLLFVEYNTNFLDALWIGIYWILQAILIFVVATRVRRFSRDVPIAMIVLVILGTLQLLPSRGFWPFMVSYDKVRFFLMNVFFQPHWVRSILIILYMQRENVFLLGMLLPSILSFLSWVFVFKEKGKYVN